MTTEYSRPFGIWPLLLCGPVLRRVTFSSVAVFIATSKSCEVTLQVQDRARQSSPWEWVSEPQDTLQIGERLHVIVVELSVELQPGVVYEYDVRMMTKGKPAEGLVDQGDLFEIPYPLGYKVGVYPSFSLPTSLSEMRMLHGSCRKPHGGGRDGLVIADELVRIAHETSAGVDATYAVNRPHLLLLTGDQIYADDVSVSLLMTLRSAGKDLLGSFSETFVPGNLEWDSLSIQPGEKRMAWLKQNSKISSDKGANHLMYLGEFYAMYILCWSEVLWPRAGSILGRKAVSNFKGLYPSIDSPDSPEKGEILEKALEHEKHILLDLSSFVADVRRVRRVLANIPTMMAFDDHEISDDWNLDGLWDRAARKDPALKQIVRNGLIAYAVFQAWGNDPKRFDKVKKGPGRMLLQTISKQPADPFPKVFSEPSSAEEYLDLGPNRVDNEERVLWDWTLAWDWKDSQPGFQAIALDTRTHRDFSNLKFAGLLLPSEIKRQLIANRPSLDEPRLCFVIAPAPVIGHPLVEEIAQPLAVISSLKGTRSGDNEAWSVNRECMEELLMELSKFEIVVILSGDVHYSFTNYTDYHRYTSDVQSINHPGRIIQLCSSALKNSDHKTRVVQEIAYAGFEDRGRGWFGTNTAFEDRLELELASPTPSMRHPWNDIQLLKVLDTYGVLGIAAKIVAIGGKLDSVAGDNLVPLYWLLLIRKLEERPLVLPDGPWFTKEARSLIEKLYDTDPGFWRYKTEFVRDRRTEEMRYSTIFDGRNIGARSHGNARQEIANAHSVIGEPNLGEIRITMLQGQPARLKEIEHRLHWWLPGGRERALTVHLAPLTKPTAVNKRTELYL